MDIFVLGQEAKKTRPSDKWQKEKKCDDFSTIFGQFPLNQTQETLQPKFSLASEL